MGFRSVVGRRLVLEIELPESRCRRKKFDADALAALAGVALINDAALLLFQRLGVNEHARLPGINLMLEQHQCAMSAYDHGFAGFAEFSPVVGAALRL